MENAADWSALAEEMSDISEAAFAAGWMDELEFRLWEALMGGPRKFGQILLTTEQLERLRNMSDHLGGWVWFNDDTGVEEFVPHEQWRMLYDRWFTHRAQRRRALE